MWKFTSPSTGTPRTARKPRPLGVEPLEDRLTPAYNAVPSAVQTLSTIGIPSHTYVAPTGTTYYVSPTGTGVSTNASAPGSARAT